MTALDRLIAFLASVSADPYIRVRVALAAVSVWLVAEAVGR